MSKRRQTSGIYRNLIEAIPAACQYACILNIPGEEQSWIGLMPQQVIKVGRKNTVIESIEGTQATKVNPSHVFERLHEFIDPGYPAYFLISADIQRSVADPDLPLILIIQPSLEISITGDQEPPQVTCNDPNLARRVTEVLARSLPASRPIPEHADTGTDSWEREPEEIIMDRLRSATGALQEKDGKIIVMRSANKSRDIQLDPFRLYEIYSALESGCAAGHIFNVGDNNFSIGMSPENIFILEKGQVFYDVVASTRGKSTDPQIDQRWKQELLEDPKERREHEMALSRYIKRLETICMTDTVQIHERMQILDLHCVRHLFSKLSGKISPEINVFDLIKQHFPPLASYPDELIPYSDSGLIPWYYYGGMIGRISQGLTTAHCYLNIRATLLREDTIHIQAGAGVIKESEPTLELLEISNKLKCLSDAISRWEQEAS